MIDEQNFPTITADMLRPGTMIWHDDELRTVGVSHDDVRSYGVLPGYTFARFTDGTLALFRNDRRFPLYVPAPADDTDPGAWVETVTVQGAVRS